MIVIYPTEGLCNKLRVVFSYNQFAQSHNQKLLVVWNRTHKCNGIFLNCFKPVENILFMKKYDIKYKMNYIGYSRHQDFYPDYTKLQILPYLQKIVDKKRKILGDKYIAVHIRRTDHVSLAKMSKRYTSDEEFTDFLKKNEGVNIYLATDNRTTQNKYIKLFPERIKATKLIDGKNKNLRKTSMKDAVIDLFTCVHADKFMGSDWSSYSGLINNLRKTRLTK